jgi:DNA modification methylase
MGTIELYHGDCLEVMKELPDKSIDLFMCDLPYACLDTKTTEDKRIAKVRAKIFHINDGMTYGHTNPWDVLIPWVPFWEQVRRLRKNAHSVVLFFCQGKFMADAICSNREEFRLALVWDKKVLTNFFDAGRRPCYNHEQILVFSEKGAYYNRVNFEGKCPTTIIRSENLTYIKCRGERYHPTEKPIDLYKRLISWYCPPGGTMLDPTAGSCNSIIAGGLIGRNAIGIEKNDTYYEKGSERIEALALATP